MQETKTQSIFSVIAASSAGTLIEWYDFYIFGSLATIISTKFFPQENPTAAILSTLATFAAGFIVRPFGALFFGRLGDIIGRKYTFLVTLVIMGLSTFLIGLVPEYSKIGFWAPLIVLLLRLLQGLALGGEYGGAATYVAEHAPIGKRGFYTSFIQITATAGLMLSLIVILTTRRYVGVQAFTQGDGWRIPFLLSILLVGVSIIIRMRMQESPLFAKLKTEGKTSTNPLKESFAKKENFKMVLLALFGATMGQGVVWYTGQFYAQSFLLNKCNVEYEQANTLIFIALLIATPGFIFFGWLSDKLGRKHIILAGMLLGVLFYRPIFQQLFETAQTKNKTEQNQVVQTSEKHILLAGSINDSVHIFDSTHFFDDGSKLLISKKITMLADTTIKKNPKPELKKELTLNNADYWKIIWLIALMVFFVTMVYGPIAAFLVELFPTRIRYTSMSLPYHIGNGVFGGLVPFIATLITTFKGSDHLSGLWYPIAVAALSFAIGALYLPNKPTHDE